MPVVACGNDQQGDAASVAVQDAVAYVEGQQDDVACDEGQQDAVACDEVQQDDGDRLVCQLQRLE